MKIKDCFTKTELLFCYITLSKVSYILSWQINESTDIAFSVLFSTLVLPAKEIIFNMNVTIFHYLAIGIVCWIYL